MNTKQTDALKLALEGLEKWHFDKDPRGAADYITAIHDALAEQPAQQQEPVAWTSRDYLTGDVKVLWGRQPPLGPLYTSPPASKPWVGLSTNDLDEIDAPIREKGHATIAEIYRAIEAKLREKNA